MIKIEGKGISEKILDELKSVPKPKNFLAVFMIGNDKASEIFIGQKEKIAKELGIDFRIYKLEGDLNNDRIKEKIKQIVSSKLCGGAVLQLPLPTGLNPSYVLNSIPPEKDVDVLSERTLGGFYNNRSKILPPSVLAVKKILESAGVSLDSDLEFAVVGQGALVGKPVSTWLSGKVKRLTILDKGDNLAALKDADVVILGTGQVGLVRASMLKNGAGVIDFGYGKKEEVSGQPQIGGDFDESSILEMGGDYLSFYTPTPGGTGPILVACLFENFYRLNQ